MPFDPITLQTASMVGYLLVFLGGVVTSLGPCNLATIPLIVGYVGGTKDLQRGRSFVLSFVFALGLAITFMILGLTAAAVGGLIGVGTRWWYYLVAVVCFLIGFNLLGVLRFNLPTWFSRLREGVGLKGIPGALVLGLISGLVASQCATPVLVAILTYVMAKGTLIYGATLLFVYALGRGVPIVLAGTFTGTLKQLNSIGKWSGTIETASGMIILAVGFYFLWIA